MTEIRQGIDSYQARDGQTHGNFVIKKMGTASNKKTILVGVDFTPSSENTVNYAALLAEKTKFSLTLFHVFDVPIVNTYSGAFFISYSDLQLSNQLKLNKYVERLQKKHPSLEIKTLLKAGSVKYNLRDIEKSHSVFCVVIGLETKTRLAKFLYGTTGVSIAGRVNCPVIIVPKNYKHHRVNKAAFAVDNKKSLNAALLSKVKKITGTLKTKLDYVHVRTHDELFPEEKIQTSKVKLEQLDAKDLSTGISVYNKINDIDLDIIASHSHSPLYRLFIDTNTKTIALSTKIPVLVIHD